MLEHRRVEAARELAQLAQRQRELVADRRHELLRRRVVADVALQEAQLQRDRDEPLLGAVVQVALEPPPLRVARRDDALARCLQLDDPRAQLGLEALRSSATLAAAETTSSSSRLMRQRRVVHERRDVLPIVLDVRHRASGAVLRQRHRRRRRAST